MSNRAVVLIGPMGAGKSSLGKRVAKGLQTSFADIDSVIVQEHGPIVDIFATQGEKTFRQWEHEAVVTELARTGVVALGGGAVLRTDTRDHLVGHDVVLLTVSPKAVAARLTGTTRPLLNTDDPIAQWETVYQERKDIYEQLADVVFDTSSEPMDQIAQRIASWVSKERS